MSEYASWYDRVVRDVDPVSVVVACYPNGPYRGDNIWARRFIGIKVGDNPDGTIRVLVKGLASDFSQSVFRK